MNTRYRRVRAVCAALGRLALYVACVALVGLALVQAWQVLARYVLNDSPSWTEPVTVLLMSTAMMLGAATGVRHDAHFGFFIAVQMAAPPLRRLLRAFARLVCAAIGVLLATWGGQLLADGWSVPMAGAPLPQGIVFLPIAVGGALIAIFSLEKLAAGEE
jgi:TRAP-type C4-dicarboxylate transport system permease small subunit